MALFILVFSIDMGRTVLAATGLQDAAAVGARAGARIGYAGSIPGLGQCEGSSSSTGNPSYDAFCESASILGGAEIVDVRIITPNGYGSRYCTNASIDDTYVTIQAKAKLDYITPGLATLVGLATGEGSEIKVTGTARCEVTR
jgi:hypothetical protein